LIVTTQTESARIASLREEAKETLRSKSLLQKAMWRLRRDKLTLTAIAVVILLALLAIFAPFISSQILRIDYNNPDLHHLYLKPGTRVVDENGIERLYILGTDEMGRDHLSRLLYGGRVSLSIGFSAATLSITIGIIIGVITGYYRGPLDDFIIWFITTLNSIPQLFLLLTLSALLSPGPTSLVLVLVFLAWTGTTRLVRGETFSLREREFVVAARAVGASDLRIMFVHIVPNIVSLLIIVVTRAVGNLILVESSLSFLGFGVKAPTPTWGNMLSGGLDLFRRAPHLVFAPGLLISITVLCMFIIGDGLRDAFDPRIAD
jgi:peptide/nickel transport system permease protein